MHPVSFLSGHLHHLHHLLHTPQEALPVLAGIAVLLGLGLWAALRRHPTAEELEAQRRALLAANGRITDGVLLDCIPALREPRVLVYRYRIAGVTYECSQDVSAFTETLRLPGLDLPVQVRYHRANPGSSIVVAEGWNGLWSAGPTTPGGLPQLEGQ